MLVPTVLQKTHDGERAYDLFSRLLRDRIIFLGEGFDDQMAKIIVAQLLFLAAEDDKKDITIYVNSPGGSASAAWAIYDTMQHVKPDVSTVCVGMAASAGSLILIGGAPGKRYSLPHSEIMIHQPLGGAQGQAEDIKIRAEQILKLRHAYAAAIAKHAGKSVKKVDADLDRDKWFTPEEAKKYGLIDKVLK